MSWTLAYSPRAVKALKTLDRTTARRVFEAIERLGTLEDPTSRCKALSGPLTGLWRLRVGDYRVVLDIRRKEVVIVAVDVGHRSKVYRDRGVG